MVRRGGGRVELFCEHIMPIYKKIVDKDAIIMRCNRGITEQVLISIVLPQYYFLFDQKSNRVHDKNF